MIDRCLTDDELWRLIRDDVPHGDLTTRALGIGSRPGRMVFLARRPMVVCCVEESARMIELAGCAVERHADGGDELVAGQILLTATGSAAALHRVWKTAQTLIDYASGIATATAAIVTAARSESRTAVVACTRKTAPGTKAIAAKAVRDGGGEMHRLGLSETLLVFPEHRCFFDEREMTGYLGYLRECCPEHRVVVEVIDADQAVVAARGGAEILQLEHFSPEAVAALAVRLRDEGLIVRLAAAGGVNTANSAAFVRAGAAILVTSAPYSAPPQQIKVVIEPADVPV